MTPGVVDLLKGADPPKDAAGEKMSGTISALRRCRGEGETGLFANWGTLVLSLAMTIVKRHGALSRWILHHSQYNLKRRYPLSPPQLHKANSIIPNLCHMPNPIPLEFHRIDVVSSYCLTGWFSRSTGTRLGTTEHGEGGHTVALLVLGEELQLIVTIGDGRQQILHPVGVSLEGIDLGQNTGLGRECRAGMTVDLAGTPSLTGFTGLEKPLRLLQLLAHRFTL